MLVSWGAFVLTFNPVQYIFGVFMLFVMMGLPIIHHVLGVAMRTSIECGYEGLRKVNLCGHSRYDFFALIEVARDLGLTRE